MPPNPRVSPEISSPCGPAPSPSHPHTANSYLRRPPPYCVPSSCQRHPRLPRPILLIIVITDTPVINPTSRIPPSRLLLPRTTLASLPTLIHTLSGRRLPPCPLPSPQKAVQHPRRRLRCPQVRAEPVLAPRCTTIGGRSPIGASSTRTGSRRKSSSLTTLLRRSTLKPPPVASLRLTEPQMVCPSRRARGDGRV